jgi:hypothetical protein
MKHRLLPPFAKNTQGRRDDDVRRIVGGAEGAGAAAGWVRHLHEFIMLLWRMKCKTLCVYRNPARRRAAPPKSKAELQRLKPHPSWNCDVVAKATTHKDQLVFQNEMTASSHQQQGQRRPQWQAAATGSTEIQKQRSQRYERQLQSQRRPPKGGRYKFKCNVKGGRSKQRPCQIKSSVKRSLLLFLVDVFGLFV